MRSVFGNEGESLLGLQPERESVPFQCVARRKCSSSSTPFGRAVLDLPVAHILIPTWLAQLLECFCRFFSIVEVARVDWQRWLGVFA